MSNRNKQSALRSQLPEIKLDTEQQAKFDIELAWCLRNVNDGIECEKDEKRVNEAMKYANTLRSPTVSLIKKRQLMSFLFGDYRAKMKQEEKQYATSKKELVKLVDQSKLENQIKKAKYLRKADAKSENLNLDNLNLTDKKNENLNSKFVMKPGNGLFKFDFNTEN